MIEHLSSYNLSNDKAMRISKGQLETLDRQSEESFIDRLMQYLRTEQTVWVADCSDEQLRQRVRCGVARARSHGFTWESSIGKFTALMFRYAPNFDQHPSIAAVLNCHDVPSEERADLLFSRVSVSQWDEAMQDYDPTAWKFEE